MNVTEVAKEITRISPAAGREAAKLVAEIARLEALNAGLNATVDAIRREAANPDSPVLLLQEFVLRRLGTALDLTVEHPTSREAFNAIFDGVVAVIQQRSDQLGVMQRGAAYRVAGEEVKEALAGALWYLFETELPEHEDGGRLWDMAIERVRETLPANRQSFKDRLRKEAIAAQERGEAVRARDVHVALRRDSNEEPNEGFPSLKDWWHSLLREVHELHNLNLERVDRRTMQAHILTTLRRSLWTEQAYEDVTPTSDEEFWDEFHQLNKKLTGGKTEARQKLEARTREVTRSIAEELSASLGGSRDRPDGYPTDMEWLSALFEAAREIRAAQEQEPRNTESRYDLAAMQANLDQVSGALSRTHGELLQMQDLFLEQRARSNKLKRSLRQAKADSDFHKGALRDLDCRLQLVDMLLRGESVGVREVAAYRTPTSDLATQLFSQNANAVMTAERELQARQELEQLLTTPKQAEVTFAECGQPYPCEHAPDGGNHPKVNGLGQWRKRAADDNPL